MPPTSLNPVRGELQSMEDIEWADLITLNLSIFHNEIEKIRLANRLVTAVCTNGFFIAKNFGIPKEVVEHQFQLCEGFFGLPLEKAFAGGDKAGYRPIGALLRE